MSQSYKKRSRRRRPHQGYTYRSREYRLRQYRKRRIRRRLLFSLCALLLLFIGGHVISIYASRGSTEQNKNTTPEGTLTPEPDAPSKEICDPPENLNSSPKEDSASDPSTDDASQKDSTSVPDSLQKGDQQKETLAQGDNKQQTDDLSQEDGKQQPKDDPSQEDDKQQHDDPSQEDDKQQNDPSDDSQESQKAGNTDSQKEEEFNFENTLFIGDSRTEGLFINTGLTEATFYAVRGLNVENIYTKAFIKDKTILAQKEEETQTKKKKTKKTEEEEETGVTIMEALNYHSWRKIYIMLGVNELGWAYESVFIERYGQLIEDIRALQPDAEIVIQSILPVTKEKSDNDDIYNNKRINRYNELIQTMAKEKEVVYADLTPAVSGKNGALPEKGSSDGVHLTKSYYLKWLDYLIEHEI